MKNTIEYIIDEFKFDGINSEFDFAIIDNEPVLIILNETERFIIYLFDSKYYKDSNKFNSKQRSDFIEECLKINIGQLTCHNISKTNWKECVDLYDSIMKTSSSHQMPDYNNLEVKQKFN